MSDHTEQARQLSRAVASYSQDLAALAQGTSREAVVIAIEGFEQAMIPMCKIQLAQRQPDMKELAKVIGMIGVRVRPDFDQRQAENWTAAMVDALDNYPARIAIAAARDAKHEPIEFPGQVLAIIQKKAESHMLSYRNRIRRLKDLLRMLDHPPLIEASDEAKAEAQLLSEQELQDMPSHLRDLGITGGWIIENDDGSIRWANEDEQEAHQRQMDERRITRAREVRS